MILHFTDSYSPPENDKTFKSDKEGNCPPKNSAFPWHGMDTILSFTSRHGRTHEGGSMGFGPTSKKVFRNFFETLI